jgi:hypothetical protein
MRITKKFAIRTTILALIVFFILETAVMIFLEKYYLADRGKIEIHQVSDTAVTYKNNVTMPENVENIQYSSDGDYVSYFSDNSVYILDLLKNSTKKVDAAENNKICTYKWVMDTDRIEIAEKNSSKNYFKFYYYDILRNEKVEIDNGTEHKVLTIKLKSSSEKVTDFQMSKGTGTIFIKITNSSNISRLCMMDRMADVTYYTLPNKKIGNMTLFSKDVELIYENISNNQIYVVGKTAPLNIDGKKELKLLGSDQNDFLYVADVKDNLINYIYYGNATVPWTKLTPNKSVDISDIYITLTGKIYINDKANSILYSQTDNKYTKYQGKLLGVFSNGVLSIQNHKIFRTSFK